MCQQASQQLCLYSPGTELPDFFTSPEEHALLRVASVYQLIEDLQPALLTSRRENHHVFDMIYRYLHDREKQCYEKLLEEELNAELFEMIKELRAFKSEYKIKRLQDMDVLFEHLIGGSLKRAGITPE